MSVLIGLTFLAAIVFAVLAVVQLVKRNTQEARKWGKYTVIILLLSIIFAGFSGGFWSGIATISFFTLLGGGGFTLFAWKRKHPKLKKISFIPLVALIVFIVSVGLTPTSKHQVSAQKTKIESKAEKAKTEASEKKESSTKSTTVTESPKPTTFELDGVKLKKPNVMTATVQSVTDGDTFKALVNGKEETVRLTLVDTPETVHPSKPVQPFGKEASDFTKEQLTGQTVGLELDAQERDQYGRLLAYVWLGDKLYNAILVDKGLARVEVFPSNTKYIDQFRTIQDHARQTKANIWSLENYVTDSGFSDNVGQPQVAAAQPAPQPSQNTNVYYKNCSAVRAAGKAPLHRGEPGYASHLDRDGDGIACENSDFDSAPASQPKAEPAPQPKSEPAPQPSQNTNVYYKNCSAVRAAGKAPLHRGEPGYASHLDRDGDGIACER
ncbi:excalibur calcium-binding domain-containing protein [Bacillus sp. CGMCC 1.60114]|uniref:thermonuclease family protein n=1 Tax=unclassified Bacillus (in: firmicutes) TaxID=185979 RepID=UPI003630C32D